MGLVCATYQQEPSGLTLAMSPSGRRVLASPITLQLSVQQERGAEGTGAWDQDTAPTLPPQAAAPVVANGLTKDSRRRKKVNTLRKLGMFSSVGKTHNYQKIPMKPQRT